MLAAGFRQLFITGLQPIKGVKLTLPTSADCRHDSHTPDQVTFVFNNYRWLLLLLVGALHELRKVRSRVSSSFCMLGCVPAAL
jgi:hypothetical protein